MEIFGQLEQDKFVLNVLKQGKNNYFCEIGSRDHIDINNSYTLEKNYNWKGLMVEYDKSHLPGYKLIRPNSIHVLEDARNIDYLKIFEENNFPINMGYLQIDLEVDNRSTLDVLEIFEKNILKKYKFAVITFEHDVYNTESLKYNTYQNSRDIFKNLGYIRVFSNIYEKNNYEGLAEPFEDWYVHPELVDMAYINELIKLNEKKYTNKVVQNLDKAIKYSDITYI